MFVFKNIYKRDFFYELVLYNNKIMRNIYNLTLYYILLILDFEI